MILVPGSRVSIHFYSDIEPATVICRTPKTVIVRVDKATLDPTWKPEMHVGGFAAHCSNQSTQRWIVEEDPDGRTMKFTLRKNDRWIQAGESKRGTWLGAGWRKFHDYNF